MCKTGLDDMRQKTPPLAENDFAGGNTCFPLKNSCEYSATFETGSAQRLYIESFL